jgi:hypothetical protein
MRDKVWLDAQKQDIAKDNAVESGVRSISHFDPFVSKPHHTTCHLRWPINSFPLVCTIHGTVLKQ